MHLRANEKVFLLGAIYTDDHMWAYWQYNDTRLSSMIRLIQISLTIPNSALCDSSGFLALVFENVVPCMQM